MTIRKKILRVLAFVIGIAVLGAGALLTLMMIQQAGRAATAKSVDLAQRAEVIRTQMVENRAFLSQYVLSGEQSDLDALRLTVSNLKDSLREAQQSTDDPGQREAFGKMLGIVNDWNASFAETMISHRKQVNDGKMTLAQLQDEFLKDPIREHKVGTFTSIDAIEQAAIDKSHASSARDDRASTVTIIAMVIGVLAIGCLAIFLTNRVARNITDPLDQITSIAREISKSGMLKHEIHIETDDETGDLARSFMSMIDYLNEMARNADLIAKGNLNVHISPLSERDKLAISFQSMTVGLGGMVSGVRDAATQVSAGSSQVADAAEESAKTTVQVASSIDEVTSTMHEMSINVQNMVKNTQMQASSVSETSASIDEMVASIQRVADTVKVLTEIGNRSRQEVQNGIDMMQKTTDGLNRINHSIGTTSEIISQLGKRADDIGKIVEVIDDISEQTNLLALNAAIEAARAGEHGLGFAVVADEVRKLAEKSAMSTKEISELIQSIQKEARHAVEDMEKSTAIVGQSLNLGDDLSNALKQISRVVTEVYNFTQEIGAATSEQSHGSTQIAKATSRLNEITHEINSSVEEQAGGAQAVVRAMERMRELTHNSTSSSTELVAAAEQMSKMARSLLESMDQFQYGNSSNMSNNSPKLPGTKFAISGRV